MGGFDVGAIFSTRFRVEGLFSNFLLILGSLPAMVDVTTDRRKNAIEHDGPVLWSSKDMPVMFCSVF